MATKTYTIGDKIKILGVEFVCVEVGCDPRYERTLPKWKFEYRGKFLTISGFSQRVGNNFDPYYVECSEDKNEGDFLSLKRALNYLELWLRRWNVPNVTRTKDGNLVELHAWRGYFPAS